MGGGHHLCVQRASSKLMARPTLDRRGGQKTDKEPQADQPPYARSGTFGSGRRQGDSSPVEASSRQASSHARCAEVTRDPTCSALLSSCGGRKSAIATRKGGARPRW